MKNGSSYHAKAFQDPFFRAYWQKEYGEVWICLNAIRLWKTSSPN